MKAALQRWLQAGRTPVPFGKIAVAIAVASAVALDLILGPMTSVHLIYMAVMAALVLSAWLRGGRWERLGAGTIAVSSAVAGMLQDPRHLLEPQYGYLALDVVVVVVLVVIALRSRLWWATWAAGFLLFGITIHVAMIVDEKVAPYAYYLGLALSYYLVLGTVMVGAWTHKRE